MTIEQREGKRRLTPNRLSDMHEGAKPEQVTQRREQLRENARYRTSKEAARAPLMAIVGDEVRKALPSANMPEESRLVAENALTLAKDAAREVAVASPFVAHNTTCFGVNAALAGFYMQKAAEAGFATPAGIELVEAAHRAEQAATRAMVAAEAAVKAFAGKQRKTIDLGTVLAEASKPRSTP